MPTPSIDRTLKGLQELRAADPAELEERVAQLEAQLEDIRFQLYVLKPLLEDARRRTPENADAPREHSAATTPDADSRQGASHHRTEDRPTTWKADAILALLKSRPHEMFSPSDVREALRADGLMDG